MFVDFVPYIHNTARVTQLPSPNRRQTPGRVSVLELEVPVLLPLLPDHLLLVVAVSLAAAAPVVGAEGVEDLGQIHAGVQLAEAALGKDLKEIDEFEGLVFY